jgi:hypothetical protein
VVGGLLVVRPVASVAAPVPELPEDPHPSKKAAHSKRNPRRTRGIDLSLPAWP